MKLTVNGEATCILILLILLYSLFYLSVPGSVIALLIILFLFIEGLSLIQTEKKIRRTIEIERIVTPLIIRQGGRVDVLIRGHLKNDSSYTLSLKDKPPYGSNLENGNLSDLTGSRNSFEWKYCISIYSLGAVRFEGVEFDILGIFFKDSMVLKEENFKEPIIHIEPAGVLLPVASSGLSGEKEWQGKGFLKGSDVRAFRDYNSTDDYRHIDWKLTAKYYKLMVKLYSGLSGTPPYIILDIPSDIYENALNDYHTLVSGVVGAIANAEREWKAWSILIISGANFIEFLPLEKSRKKIFAILSNFKPLNRQNNEYRLIDRAFIKRHQYIVEDKLRNSNDQVYQKFYGNLYQKFSMSQENREITRFESQIYRVFNRQKSSGVYLFSDFKGDLSHIAKIIVEAKKQGINVHGRIPPGEKDKNLLRTLAAFGIDSFEVIS